MTILTTGGPELWVDIVKSTILRSRSRDRYKSEQVEDSSDVLWEKLTESYIKKES